MNRKYMTDDIDALDARVLQYMRTQRDNGTLSMRAGAVAKKFGVDSVQALGAMLRVKDQLDDETKPAIKRSCDE